MKDLSYLHIGSDLTEKLQILVQVANVTSQIIESKE
jgi:hypothetical protein